MKAEELRIGNLIRPMFKGNICEECHTVELTTLFIVSGEVESQIYFNPIELTKEWLFKFGYGLITENHFAIKGHLIWVCNDLLMCEKNGIILRHVHQLQNLYFSLTQTELTLNQ